MRVIKNTTLLRAVNAIQAVSNSNVRAIDLYYYHERVIDESSQFHSFSLGESSYLKDDGILKRFLQEKGSLARLDRSVRKTGSISSSQQLPLARLRYEKIEREFDRKEYREASIEELCEHLQDSEFGKQYFWIGIHQSVGTTKIHLSTFVVIDRNLSAKKSIETSAEILWLMQSKFMNLIAEDFSYHAETARQELGLARELVEYIRHIWKNIGFKGNLSLLGDALDGGQYGEASKLAKNLRRLSLFHDIASDILYKTIAENPEELLLEKKGITSYTRIVRLICSSMGTLGDCKIDGITKRIENHPKNRVGKDDLINVFVLIVNIIANAYERNKISTVRFSLFENGIKIEVNNEKIMPGKVKEYLKQRVPEKSFEGDGVDHIVRTIGRIDGLKMDVDTSSEGTSVTLFVL